MGDATFTALAMEEHRAKRRHDKAGEAAAKAKLDAYQAACKHPSFKLARAPFDSPKRGIVTGDRLRICALCNKLLSVEGVHAKHSGRNGSAPGDSDHHP